MANAYDVAAYILEKNGPMSAMKLQKLVYYSQAWSLVWDEVALFPERTEAWANGPVVSALYSCHKGQFQVEKLPYGDPVVLTPTQRETIDSVLSFYGDKPGQWLSELTHSEDPWKNAREGCAPGQYCTREITPAAMAEYYGSL